MESSKLTDKTIEELIALAQRDLDESTVYNDIDEFIINYNIISGSQRIPVRAFGELYTKLTNKKFDGKYFEAMVNPKSGGIDGQVDIDLKNCKLDADELVRLTFENQKRKEKAKKERAKEKGSRKIPKP
jgi:hypothetical protein